MAVINILTIFRCLIHFRPLAWTNFSRLLAPSENISASCNSSQRTSGLSFVLSIHAAQFTLLTSNALYAYYRNVLLDLATECTTLVLSEDEYESR